MDLAAPHLNWAYLRLRQLVVDDTFDTPGKYQYVVDADELHQKLSSALQALWHVQISLAELWGLIQLAFPQATPKMLEGRNVFAGIRWA